MAPALVFKVPSDGFPKARFKGLLRPKAQFHFNFAGINGIAKIMAWAIADISDEASVRLMGGIGAEFIEEVT